MRTVRIALGALLALNLIGAITAAAIGVKLHGDPYATAACRDFLVGAIGALVTFAATSLFEDRAHG